MTDFAKPVGDKLGWKLLDTTHPFQSPFFKLRADRLQIKDGETTTYTYMQRGDAVIVVPVTRDGQMIMIRQYRYPVDDWCLEVPAGGSHDQDGAPLEDIVRHEMQEEIGATCGVLRYITNFYTANSLVDEKCHIYLALDVQMGGEQTTEETEDIEIHIEPVARAMEMAKSGQIKTAPCALAILLCENALRECGLL